MKSSKADHIPRFATTPSEFKLSSRTRCLHDSARRRQRPASTPFPEDPLSCLPDVVRLRSTAFWELRRSITDNGEGLVRRMRDYERTRLRSQVYQKAKDAEKRGRKRLSRRKKQYIDLSEASDEEEILISSIEFSKTILRPPSAGKRARSMDAMDMDVDSEGWACTSHARSRSSQPSANYTGELRNKSSGVDGGQSTTEDVDSNVSSEPASPPLPSPTYGAVCPSSQSNGFPSSASEKAIAALSLALENGAGSINDYSSVWTYQGHPISQPSDDHGELWH